MTQEEKRFLLVCGEWRKILPQHEAIAVVTAVMGNARLADAASMFMQHAQLGQVWNEAGASETWTGWTKWVIVCVTPASVLIG